MARTSRLRAVTSGAMLFYAFAAAPGTASATPGDLHLVSSRADGTKGSGLSFQTSQSVSADGTRVAFQSLAPNLVGADPDSASDIFVKDLRTGTLVLASTNAAGVKSNGDSFDASLSADGTVVAFASTATNLHPDDGDPLMDVYVKNLTTGAVAVASRNAAGVKGADRSDVPSLSGDGRTVAFESSAANLDPADQDTIADIYVKDLASGALTLVSATPAGVKGNNFSTMPALAGNGAAVAFQSRSTNLQSTDLDPLADIYVKNLATGGLELVSATAAGTKGAEDSFHPSLSADGNRVAFHTASTNLDPADTDPNVADVYVKDRAGGALLLASTTAAGVKAQGGPFLGSADASLSADGTRVAFESFAANLDPADTDSAYDVYAKDLATGDLGLMTTTIQDVKANADSGVAALAPDGHAVAFVSAATNLSPSDTDTLPDVYLKQRRGQTCTDFSGSALGGGANPRTAAGHVIRVTSPAAATTEVRRDGQLRGLNIRRRAVVELAAPSRAVAIRLGRFAQPVTVIAYNASGGQAGTKTMAAPQGTLAQLVFKGSDIVRLALSAPQQEALLVRLCHRPVCTITGTTLPDTLTGTPAKDAICGLAGDDVIRGLGGDDRAYGGPGDDRIRAGAGADRMFGARGGDRLSGKSGADRVFGGRGRDRLSGGRGADRLRGGPQNDRCAGGAGHDLASGCESVTGVP